MPGTFLYQDESRLQLPAVVVVVVVVIHTFGDTHPASVNSIYVYCIVLSCRGLLSLTTPTPTPSERFYPKKLVDIHSTPSMGDGNGKYSIKPGYDEASNSRPPNQSSARYH